MSSLLNQLFGKGKDPFWQQAYTNLVKWIIELYRIFPDRWVTLQDVYRCAISPAIFQRKIEDAIIVVEKQKKGVLTISAESYETHMDALLELEQWAETPRGEREAPRGTQVERWLQTNGVPYKAGIPDGHTDTARLELRLKSVVLWYEQDWMQLDPKLRTSCVEGISSFLSLFDMEDVAAVFCPKAPERRAAMVEDDAGDGPGRPGGALAGTRRPLPALDELIETGKSPGAQHARRIESGAGPRRGRVPQKCLAPNPAPAAGADEAGAGRYFRPAVFICDEYQSFASVGEDDPSGDEKAFALTRQCRVIPIVATQSISSLRSVLGTSEAWRALLQTLRTRIFLSLSDDASAEIASKLCGQVAKIKPSWTVTESAQQAQVSLLSGKAGGSKGSVGTSKSFREQREALFQPREFGLLPNCQAICLPYDGTHATSAVRVYLKPYYLPVTTPYWRAVEAGQI